MLPVVLLGVQTPMTTSVSSHIDSGDTPMTLSGLQCNACPAQAPKNSLSLLVSP